MKNLALVSLMVITMATAISSSAAPAAPEVDYKHVCDQILEAFTGCGYPDPGIVAAGGCSDKLGQVFASGLDEQITQNKTKLASMQTSNPNASATDDTYKKLQCINSKYEAISRGLK